MALVTDGEVKQILDTSVDTTPFILAADILVTTYLSGAGLSAELLKEIERWLAAHLTCARDPRFLQARTGDGDAMVFERGKTGSGLDATTYGQQVKLLDPTGLLANAANTDQPATFNVM